ncbi:MAG TPA: ABC transporter substrate-binding protein [Planctomycetota bacterium]
MLPQILCLALLVLQEPARAPAPIRLGLAVPAEPVAEVERAFREGAELAAAIRNRRGGLLGQALELVPLGSARVEAEARALAPRLAGAGLVAVLAPRAGVGLDALRPAAERAGLVLLAPSIEPAAEAELLARTLVGRLRFARLALLQERGSGGKALASELERRLAPPCALVARIEVRLPARDLAARLAEAEPDVLVADLEPATLAALLAGPLEASRLPLVTTARATLDPATLGREHLFVHGLSAATEEPRGEFLAEFRARHGEPGPGAVEGYELVELVAVALERGGGVGPEDLRAALATARLAGPRGVLQADARGLVAVPAALWRFVERSRPHDPPVPAEGQTIPDGAGRAPEARLGPPFGALRTDGFLPEPGSRTVRLHFGGGDARSIEADLARLGLATGGASPVLDHLVREELLARTLAIVSQKYLRAPDGAPIPGQSLRVTFVAHLPQSAARGAWEAVLAGADPSANGRAFPGSGVCHVFATNWLATVQAHALEVPLGPDDLGLLDGTYVFGSDYRKDARSELVRALIAGYASSLGLTTAHEVGHLFDLDHDTGDPQSLMNVDGDEIGLAPEDAHFTEAALELLRKNPGVVKGDGK